MVDSLEAFLDIETTGLSACGYEITVIGIFLDGGEKSRFMQLMGERTTADNLL